MSRVQVATSGCWLFQVCGTKEICVGYANGTYWCLRCKISYNKQDSLTSTKDHLAQNVNSADVDTLQLSQPSQIWWSWDFEKRDWFRVTLRMSEVPRAAEAHAFFPLKPCPFEFLQGLSEMISLDLLVILPFPAHTFTKEYSTACCNELPFIPSCFGPGALLGLSLLSLLCILEVNGSVDKNRNCQRSQHQALWVAVCAVLLQTVPSEGQMETPTHPHNRISQLLNIDLAQQGLGPDLKWRQVHSLVLI